MIIQWKTGLFTLMENTSMKKFKCYVAKDGTLFMLLLYFEDYEHAYANLEAEGYKPIYIKEVQ